MYGSFVPPFVMLETDLCNYNSRNLNSQSVSVLYSG
jgi:hypothetical protein